MQILELLGMQKTNNPILSAFYMSVLVCAILGAAIRYESLKYKYLDEESRVKYMGGTIAVTFILSLMWSSTDKMNFGTFMILMIITVVYHLYKLAEETDINGNVDSVSTLIKTLWVSALSFMPVWRVFLGSILICVIIYFIYHTKVFKISKTDIAEIYILCGETFGLALISTIWDIGNIGTFMLVIIEATALFFINGIILSIIAWYFGEEKDVFR